MSLFDWFIDSLTTAKESIIDLYFIYSDLQEIEFSESEKTIHNEFDSWADSEMEREE